MTGDDPFREHYDGAVLGTVRAVVPLPGGGGDVGVHVDVTGWLGEPQHSTVVLVSPDDGGDWGYLFEKGRHYFIPFEVRDGTPRSRLCDPIHEVDEVDAAAIVHAADGRSGRCSGFSPPGRPGGRGC